MATSVSKSGVGTGILLEAGTNELEVLLFQVSGHRFGVNVAKVREALEIGEITSTTGGHAAAEGVVRVRELVISLVNLAEFLFPGEPQSQPKPTDRMLFLEFNNEQIAFRGHSVDRIHRLSWKNVEPMPQLPGKSLPVTSIVRIGDSIVQLLDFESIGVEFGMSGGYHAHHATEGAATVDQMLLPIVFADDSAMIRERLKDELLEAGYTNITGFQDGASAWEHLQDLAADCQPNNLHEKVACLVTDIEMPRMNGLTLARSVRSHATLRDLPVVLFSSIASKDNENKAAQVGATAQVAKPQYQELVEKVAEILDERWSAETD